MRKDCDQLKKNHSRARGPWVCRVTLRPAARSCRANKAAAIATVLLALHSAGAASAQTSVVRLWPSAVIVEDGIRLTDLCELQGFTEESPRPLTDLIVAEAPPPGGSRIIHMDAVRSAIAAGGVNLATVTLRGAAQCAVTRPAMPDSTTDAPSSPKKDSTPAAVSSRTVQSANASASPTTDAPSDTPTDSSASTLRQAVMDHFNAEMARYGGSAEVVFDRTSDQLLNLSGPSYEFKIQRRGGPLGLTPIEVNVVAHGQSVQTVPLIVQVSLQRPVLVARRSINQGALIREIDLDRSRVTMTRLDALGLDQPSQAVGQRAKRFISAGAQLEADMLESVPLVRRGELVTLTSVVGGVRVVTTAKADGDGLLGESVKVRAVDNKRVEFDAVVTGPAQVRVSGEAPEIKIAAAVPGDRP